jgi:hypothetical protein
MPQLAEGAGCAFRAGLHRGSRLNGTLGWEEGSPVPFSGHAYTPTGFARIERWQDTVTGIVHWRTVTKDNVTSLYGRDCSSQIADPGDPSQVFTWLLDFSYDDRGNAISYQYKAEDAANVPAAASEQRHTVDANHRPERPSRRSVSGWPGGGWPRLAHCCARECTREALPWLAIRTLSGDLSLTRRPAG